MFMSKNNSIDGLLKTYKTNLSSKSDSNLHRLANNKTASKNEEFKDVLSSKATSKEQDTQEIDYVNKNNTATEPNNNEVDELKEKLEELDEESKSASKDEVNDILTALLNLLTKLGVKDDVKSSGEIDSNILRTTIEGINGNESSNGSLNSIMEKLMDLLKNDSAKDKLDTTSLNLMKKLLSNLSDNLVDDNKATTNIKSLMTEISNILDNNENQTKKVLTLEEMLNKNYSQDSNENSGENDDDSFTSSKNSKENKFLNSLISDKDNSLDKINLFASRTAAMQNQGADTVRGLTINKATFANDLIKDIKFMSNNELKELIVKVNPGNLGEITIKLVQEDGIMKANLKANSKETAVLLSQNLTDIKKQLVEQNIKITDVNIELYQDDTTFFRDQGFGRQLSDDQGRNNNGGSTNTTNDTIISEEELVDNMAYNDNNVEFFA